MAKLSGKAKAAFLRKMRAGRAAVARAAGKVTGAVRRHASKATAMVRRHAAPATRHSKRSGSSSGGGGWKGALKTGLVAGGIGFAGFLASRFATYFLLGEKEDGTRRDSGWMGYAGNIVATGLGFWLLRRFKPGWSMAWLGGGLISIFARFFTSLAPANQSARAGLTATDPPLLEGSGGDGTGGVYDTDGNARGAFLVDRRAA